MIRRYDSGGAYTKNVHIGEAIVQIEHFESRLAHAVLNAWKKYVPGVKSRANKTKELVRLAIDKAQVFSGDQPVSVSDFRRQVDELRETGFVLQQTLYGMLDMLEDEGKKIV